MDLDSPNSRSLQEYISQTSPPKNLFHYTSTNGLIGIISNKTIWATHTEFLNDKKEIIQAINQTKNAIENIRRKESFTSEEKMLLDEMHSRVGSAARRIYVCSFSELADSLPQWRAYGDSGVCYAIGFPSCHLQNVAEEQSFKLVKCIYDHSLQYRICSEIVWYYITEFRNAFSANSDYEKLINDIVWKFYQNIARIGGVMKHPAFKEEQEWRIISGVIEETRGAVSFRAGKEGLVPHYNFNLVSDKYPDLAKPNGVPTVIRLGPSIGEGHYNQTALQFFVSTHLNGAAFGPTDIPYKNW